MRHTPCMAATWLDSVKCAAICIARLNGLGKCDIIALLDLYLFFFKVIAL